MYKTLVIDLDDTLLGEDLKIAPQAKQMISQIKDKVRVMIATGRMHSSALPYARELDLQTNLITYNGALVKDLVSGDQVIHKPVSGQMVEKIAAYAQDNDLHLNFYIDDTLYVNKMGKEADYYKQISGIDPVLIDNKPDEFLTKPSTKLIIVEHDEARREQAKADLEELVGDRLSITSSKTSFIELNKKGTSKAEAVKELISRFNWEVTPEEVMAIGDSYNDLELIKYAGLGVAVGNAQSGIKEAADYITAGNDEGGVAEAITKFIKV
jgi:Cof subfamily protein (haloacid dehalogenase superfamily)